MKRILPVFLAFSIALAMTACSQERPPSHNKPENKDFFAMDTYISLTAYGEQANDALKAAQERTETLERLWSVTDAGSEIYAINHSGGRPVMVSDDTAEVLAFALEMADQTGGALEPTIYPLLTAWGFTTGENRVPDSFEIKRLSNRIGYEKVRLAGNEVQLEDGMMLDLGSVGKGCASDEIAQILREHGVSSALLDFGGNILMIGSKPDGSDWRLGIKAPIGEGNIGVLESSDCAVVTSGNYERTFTGEDGKQYGHIIDPATGHPADSGLLSVTIIGPEGGRCDALSTALFIMGADDAISFWREQGGFEMLLVTDENEVLLTEGIAERFTLAEGRQEDVTVIAS